MNHLRRDLAPISDSAWDQVDREATRSLENFLSARRLVDFHGPIGWDAACVPVGRSVDVATPVDGVAASARVVRPLIELRTSFALDRAELDAVDRGASDPDLAPVTAAGRRAAMAEDRLVFDGDPAVGVVGVIPEGRDAPLIDDDYGVFPGLVARAIATLRDAGVDGPYAIALGPRCYTGVIETTEHGGYPVLEHLRLIAGGPVIRAPGVDGSVVVSQRGGDHHLTVGEDWSIGYVGHDDDVVRLYLEASLTFANDTPEAAVALRHR